MAASSIGTLIPLNFPYSKMKTRAQAILTNGSKMRVPYELKQGQTRLFHKLPSGLKMEVIFQKKGFFSDPAKELEESHKPPIVFVHGSFHAGWCWAEHWLPFFSRHGFNCYAVSLLGQGESDAPAAPVAGSLQTHANDIADFIHKEIRHPPVLIGHSFGGLIVQYYIANLSTGDQKGMIQENKSSYPRLSKAVLVCSVPPSVG